jgi:gas vesicle protein
MKDKAVIFLAGLGVGAAAAVLLAPTAGDELRDRIRDGATRTRDRLKPAAIRDSVGNAIKRGQQALSEKFSSDKTEELKSDMRDGIDDAAEATKKLSDRAIDKSTDLAHRAGKSMERTGKRLQEA